MAQEMNVNGLINNWQKGTLGQGKTKETVGTKTATPIQTPTAAGRITPASIAQMTGTGNLYSAVVPESQAQEAAAALATPKTTTPTPASTGNGGTSGGGTQKTATYIDKSGNKQTGVYSQAAEEAEGGEAAPSHWDEMRTLYQQMYDEQVAANNAANEAAAERAREAAQQQIDALNAGYQGTNRQLYRDYMEHQRTLPQEMAARGYSGGLSESSQLRLRNAYEEGLAENERARLAQESSANANLAQQLYEAQAAATAANQQANQQRLGYLTALQEQQYQDQQQRAATLASAGDFSGYAELGYSDSEIRYLQNIWARQNPALAYSLGKISAGTYYKLTGAYPPGYVSQANRTSYGGGGSNGGTVKQSAADLASQAFMAGASPAEVSAAIDASVQTGEISQKDAADAKLALWAEQYARGAASRGR